MYVRLFFLTLALAALSCSRADAQLAVSGAMTPQQLVQNVLLGPGVTATNITYTGASIAIGSFSNGQTTNLGLSTGILLTSGDIINAPGPNNSSSQTTVNNLNGDPDLDIILTPQGIQSHDASVLEFDFVPNGDTVKFKYVFGSEEYPEFANSSFNDVFAFILSGVSTPMAPTNIALVPSSATPVSINTVNCQNNSPYYICNDLNNNFGYCGPSYSCTPNATSTLQYDGFTWVLTAMSPVICGETYHIKLAIADGGDWSYDSGVFLEAGSFSSSSTVSISANVNFGGNDTVMYEGCSQATIVFDRGSGNLGNADTLYYSITGSGTNGTDYSFIPDSVYFPPGLDTAFINVSALADALPEGTETITLTATFTNPCNNQTTTSSITLYIVDAPPLTVAASNDTFITCPGEVIPLSAQAAGGVGIGGYNYTWSPGGNTTSAINVTPSQTTTYTVTATDSCGVVQATDMVTITVLPYTYPQVTVTPATICKGETTDLIANVTGGLPQYTLNWTDASGPVSSNDTITVTPAATNTYSVTVSDYCNNSASTSAAVTVSTTTASFTYTHETNSIIDLTDQSALDVISWSWDFGDGESLQSIQNPEHTYADTGIYTITLVVMNSAGCIDTFQNDVIVLPDMFFYFPSAFTPNGDGKNDYFTAYGLGIDKYNMMIFNRWGNLVYQTDDMSRGWDGKTRSGDAAEEEVYICVFNIEGDVDGVKQKVKHIGRVTLLR